MKNIFLMLLLICLATVPAKAQQNDNLPAKTGYSRALVQDKTLLISNNPAYENGPAKDHDYYNRKSRNQRIIGLSLLGGGLVFGGIALLSSSNYQYVDYEASVRHDRTVATLFILSAATGIASIPFMIMAHSSKVKARAALSTQKTFIPGKTGNHITGIAVSIPIGR